MKNEAADEAANAVKGKMNADGHLEVSGRIRGRLRIGPDVVELDALAHRDRSWGARDYRSAYQHRMLTGTLGPQLSWATFIMHLDNGFVAKAGFTGSADQGFAAVTEGWLVSSHHFIGLEGPSFTILDATNRPCKGGYIPRQAELSKVCATEGLSKAADYGSLHWR